MLGFGDAARPVTAVVAVLLSVGAINAYFAGGARLGAALARDGSLPVWLARGSTAGEVPRRSLAVVALGGLASLGRDHRRRPLAQRAAADDHRRLRAGLRGRHGGRDPAAARPAGYAGAPAVGFVATLGLLALTGTHLLGPALIGAGALAWTALHRTDDYRTGAESSLA